MEKMMVNILAAHFTSNTRVNVITINTDAEHRVIIEIFLTTWTISSICKYERR